MDSKRANGFTSWVITGKKEHINQEEEKENGNIITIAMAVYVLKENMLTGILMGNMLIIIKAGAFNRKENMLWEPKKVTGNLKMSWEFRFLRSHMQTMLR